MKKNLKRKLDSVKIPSYTPEKLEETIRSAQKIKIPLGKLRMTRRQFFISQFRFVHLLTWILKISIVVLCLLFKEKVVHVSEEWTYFIFFISGMVLSFDNLMELSRVYAYQMLELQTVTKYSLKEVVLSRLGFMAIMDVNIIIIITSVFYLSNNSQIWFGLYCVVPYFLMHMGGVLIFRYFKYEDRILSCIALAGVIFGIILALKGIGYRLYSTDLVGVWLIVGMIGLIGTVWQVIMLIKQYGGNKDGFDVRAFV